MCRHMYSSLGGNIPRYDQEPGEIESASERVEQDVLSRLPEHHLQPNASDLSIGSAASPKERDYN